MTSALITGVAGQDGAYLANHLLGQGYRVIGTVANHAQNSAFIEAYLSGVDLRVVDLADRPAMRDLLERERPDEIYNLASISSVAKSWTTPIEVTQINGLAVLALLEDVRALRDRTGHSPRICQASSSEIFGTPTHLPQGEGAPIAPTNPYGTAKALAHLSVANYRDAFGLPASTVILFNHESPLRPGAFVTRKITSAAARLARGSNETLELGRQDIRRDWGGASDYVRVMHLALQGEQAGDYVVATGVAHSLGELVELAFEAAGVRIRPGMVVTNPAFVRPNDVAEMRGDPSRAELRLGWQRDVSFQQVVRRMVSVDLRRLDTGIEHDPAYLRLEGLSNG